MEEQNFENYLPHPLDSRNILSVRLKVFRIQNIQQRLIDVCRGQLTVVQQRLMIAVDHKDNWRQDLVHALTIAHIRMLAGVVEQDICHGILNQWLAKEVDAWKRAHHILTYDRK